MAAQVIRAEIAGLEELARLCAPVWEQAADALAGCRGKVIVCGLGKSGHIGKKWAATFASLGTPAFFLHATEALHGDLGMVGKDDVMIAISNSGTTAEVVAAAAFAKGQGTPVLAVTKNADSPLAKMGLHLPLPMAPEADPNGLAPTTSTTATLVMGDVLAVMLAARRGFGPADFGRVHPGGALGKAAAGA